MDLNNSKIAVIGLGYVGLPLAVEFGKIYSTIGFDINEGRINELQKRFDKTLEVNEEELKKSKNLILTSEINDLREYNIFIVTVPTPIDNHKRPNLGPLLNASSLVGKVLKKNDIVIYESTVYPGCTEEDCVPVLERESGLKFNQDFYCGYSPERINPGDKEHNIKKIMKVTSGSTPEKAQFVDNLYKSIITIGEYAFIGAGAVVNKDVKSFALWRACPRQIGWMSEHGEQLELPLSGNGEAACPHTGIRYKLEDGTCLKI